MFPGDLTATEKWLLSPHSRYSEDVSNESLIEKFSERVGQVQSKNYSGIYEDRLFYFENDPEISYFKYEDFKINFQMYSLVFIPAIYFLASAIRHETLPSSLFAFAYYLIIGAQYFTHKGMRKELSKYLFNYLTGAVLLGLVVMKCVSDFENLVIYKTLIMNIIYWSGIYFGFSHARSLVETDPKNVVFLFVKEIFKKHPESSSEQEISDDGVLLSKPPFTRQDMEKLVDEILMTHLVDVSLIRWLTVEINRLNEEGLKYRKSLSLWEIGHNELAHMLIMFKETLIKRMTSHKANGFRFGPIRDFGKLKLPNHFFSRMWELPVDNLWEYTTGNASHRTHKNLMLRYFAVFESKIWNKLDSRSFDLVDEIFCKSREFRISLFDQLMARQDYWVVWHLAFGVLFADEEHISDDEKIHVYEVLKQVTETGTFKGLEMEFQFLLNWIQEYNVLSRNQPTHQEFVYSATEPYKSA